MCPAPAPSPDLAGWNARVRDAFHDQPGLRLTLAQAARLWSLDQRSCARVLHSLVSMGVLVKTPDDRYCRVDQSTSYE
jgi:DNA-binding IclR family transcriptional regulator